MQSVKALLQSLLLAVTAASANTGGVIVVDDEHLQMQSSGVAKPSVYSVPAGQSLVVDATAYRFKIPDQFAKKPVNSVQLVLASNEQYSAVWPAATRRVVLSSTTLTPNPGSRPFSGLRSGQDGIIAIGHMDSGKFSVIWVGMFSVK